MGEVTNFVYSYSEKVFFLLHLCMSFFHCNFFSLSFELVMQCVEEHIYPIYTIEIE